VKNIVTLTSIAAAVVPRMNGGYAQSSDPLVTMIDMLLAFSSSLVSSILIPPGIVVSHLLAFK